MYSDFPEITTDNEKINSAIRICYSDIKSNIKKYRGGILRNEQSVFIAGEDYVEPWTRDAAINVWNGAGLIAPEISKNTLLSVLFEENGKIRVGGQYWDAIIWVIGAYNYFLYTCDEAFLPLLIEVTENSLSFFEKTEFDSQKNLFRGPACYGDGVSAYTDIYARAGHAGILDFVKDFPQYKVPTGEGNPMFALSTNCLYFKTYEIAYGLTGNDRYKLKAEKLKNAINRYFWNEEKGFYKYCIDPFGGSDAFEGIGESFALLFGVANDNQRKSIIKNAISAAHGMPCLSPEFDRYKPYGVGRHCGTVWPQIQAFWAEAVSVEAFSETQNEIIKLTENVIRDGTFSEIYHPETGLRYGGVQEWEGKIIEWGSGKRQLWSATGYLRMILFAVCGFKFSEQGLIIQPVRNALFSGITVSGLRYGKAILDISINNFDEKKFVDRRIGKRTEIIL